MFFLIYRNSSLEGASLNNSNPLIQFQTEPESKTSTKSDPLLGHINNRTSFKSADKVTIERIVKNSDEMSEWSCKRVGQYLDEINMGQYKQVNKIFISLIKLNCLETTYRKLK